MTLPHVRAALTLVLVGAAIAACGGGSSSGPAAGTTPPAGSSNVPTSASPANGPAVTYSSQGYKYSARAVTPVGTTVEISSPYLTATDSAPAGQQIATVTIEVTNTQTDRPEPLAIATVGDIDFSFAVPSKDSTGLPDQWQGDCNVTPAPTTASHGLCVDLATRVQSTTPSLVDEAEPQIPPGGTVTMRLYSSALPTSFALSKLQFIYVDPIDGTQTHIPLSA